ncbi:transforming growth factor beta receptor type 3 [Kryptolebias marmoratus]|uniref:transforming growth factor beta receptor type 3 n=1 Tax=Kryptolebias marmoratus TaxID=37003 RepID=UPI0007F88EB7|nr:transforming growth factor beta receptor type 3 [Kryptolebias marmoratus]
MPSLSVVGRSVFCLVLLWEKLAAQTLACSTGDPVAARHPVQALLETFQTGRACVARERGSRETHAVALDGATNSSGSKVTVLLKRLSLSPVRTVHLVLSSKHRVTWLLEAEQFPPDHPVFVQVSAGSGVRSRALRAHVREVRLLPRRPHALQRWALRHHGNLSSLVHARRGNRVYVRLGEDPALPDACRLQASAPCPRFAVADLQPQRVKGWSWVRPAAGPDVHLVRLGSAGSGLCSSPQAEVTVSLVPPAASLKERKVVLILSSSVPVGWVVTAHGVRGHVSVHSSSGVSLPSPPEPNLTLSSTLDPDLSAVSDLLIWAEESGYSQVTSYTEAHLANRFVVHLTEDGTGRQGLTVSCEGGLLGVTLDRQQLQGVSAPVAAVTLQDQKCQARSNGSHFLLTLPVIFCGTEAKLVEEPRGVLYRNRVLLWRKEPQTIPALEEENVHRPLSVQISCFAASPSRSAADDSVALPLIGRFARGADQAPESVQGLGHRLFPRHRSEPVVRLKLFVAEGYEQTWIGPCIITAGHRVFVEISAKASLADAVQVRSCFVSPLSDPKKPPFWTAISDGCSSDPSLTIGAEAKGEEEEQDEDGGENKGETGGQDGREKRRNDQKGIGASRMHNSTQRDAETEIRSLRFSFILRPVFTNPMQFVHCSLLLCLSGSTRGPPTKEAARNDCPTGRCVPALVSGPLRQECEIRNLSRPMLVTRPISSLAPKAPPPAGRRTNSLRVAPVASPDPENSSLGVQTGPLMGIVFAAFGIGVGLMGALWCIYNFTGKRPERYLTDQTNGGYTIKQPAALSDQSSSSV